MCSVSKFSYCYLKVRIAIPGLPREELFQRSLFSTLSVHSDVLDTVCAPLTFQDSTFRSFPSSNFDHVFLVISRIILELRFY